MRRKARQTDMGMQALSDIQRETGDVRADDTGAARARLVCHDDKRHR
jgi:hypothetical protein